MRPPGPLLASGRDADIFEYGPGLVLRRSRAGRSLSHEARTIEFLHAQGYPVPAVDELSEDGTELAMERIDGRTMVDALARAPWTIRQHARTLADLHTRLHGIPAPTWMPKAPIGTGTAIVHMDLHPLNVVMSPRGPVVIDWTNTALGDALVDVGIAWVLMATGQVPANRLEAGLLTVGRSLLVRAFLAQVDREQVATRIREIVAWKVDDPHMSAAEVDAMWKLAAKVDTAGRTA